MVPDLETRLSSLRHSMGREGIGLAVYAHGPIFQYLTALPPIWRQSRDHLASSELLLVPVSGVPTLISGNADVIAESAGDIRAVMDIQKPSENLLNGLVAATNGDVAVGRELKGDTWLDLYGDAEGRRIVPGWNLLDGARAIKDSYEIDKLKKAAALTDEAVKRAIEDINEGITMRELQLQIEMHGRKLGASGVSFSPVSGFIQPTGTESESIFSYEIDEGLRPGTTIFFDIGFVLDGYCSDWGRSVYFGDPEAEVQDAYAHLNMAMIATVGEIEPGHTRAADVFDMIESHLEPSGFAHLLRARLPSRSVGHQIGVEVHENPWLDPRGDSALMPGMIMCVEPKLLRKGAYYLRVEDMIFVGTEGAEILTVFDRELFSIG